jgi:hypothetical protein
VLGCFARRGVLQDVEKSLEAYLHTGIGSVSVNFEEQQTPPSKWRRANSLAKISKKTGMRQAELIRRFIDAGIAGKA